jgi:hypothetical protein
MIRYLKHKEIDKQRWDACIGHAVNRRVYAFSWYLDIVCDGWDALVGDDYAFVFPLTHRRKLGIGYLYQPFFAQQLGLFSGGLLSAALVKDVLAAIPANFRFVEIHLNSMNKVDFDGAEIITRVNHELDLIGSYEHIYGHYAQNCRRNLKKAREHDLTVGRKTEPDELVSLFRDNFGKKEGVLTNTDYHTILRLLGYCLDKRCGQITGVYNSGGTLTAAAFFLKDNGRFYYLFAASAPEARENGAMFMLIDHFIRQNAGEAATLDFEGGNDVNLGRFYKSFGASEVPYPMVRLNRLPKLLNRGLNLRQRLKG